MNISDSDPTAGGRHIPGSTDISMPICVPGDYLQTPWNMSRDALRIHEDFYMSLEVSNAVRYLYDGSGSFYYLKNFTTHCSIDTTRGYFELGNYFNNYLPQPLLEEFPSIEEAQIQYNDYGIRPSWSKTWPAPPLIGPV